MASVSENLSQFGLYMTYSPREVRERVAVSLVVGDVESTLFRVELPQYNPHGTEWGGEAWVVSLKSIIEADLHPSMCDWRSVGEYKKHLVRWLMGKAVKELYVPGSATKRSTETGNQIIAADRVWGMLPAGVRSFSATIWRNFFKVVLSCGCSVEFGAVFPTELDWYCGEDWTIIRRCPQHCSGKNS